MTPRNRVRYRGRKIDEQPVPLTTKQRILRRRATGNGKPMLCFKPHDDSDEFYATFRRQMGLEAMHRIRAEMINPNQHRPATNE